MGAADSCCATAVIASRSMRSGSTSAATASQTTRASSASPSGAPASSELSPSAVMALAVCKSASTSGSAARNSEICIPSNLSTLLSGSERPSASSLSVKQRTPTGTPRQMSGTIANAESTYAPAPRPEKRESFPTSGTHSTEPSRKQNPEAPSSTLRADRVSRPTSTPRVATTDNHSQSASANIRDTREAWSTTLAESTMPWRRTATRSSGAARRTSCESRSIPLTSRSIRPRNRWRPTFASNPSRARPTASASSSSCKGFAR